MMSWTKEVPSKWNQSCPIRRPFNIYIILERFFGRLF